MLAGGGGVWADPSPCDNLAPAGLDRGEALDRHADEIVQAFLDAGLKGGDWRALEALVTRHYGRPVERVEMDSSSDDVDLRSLSDLELQQLKRRLQRAVASKGG